jgi:primosomal protein N''
MLKISHLERQVEIYKQREVQYSYIIKSQEDKLKSVENLWKTKNENLSKYLEDVKKELIETKEIVQELQEKNSKLQKKI